MTQSAARGAKRLAGTGGGMSAAVVVAWALEEFAMIAVPTDVGIAMGGLFTIIGNWIVSKLG